MVTTAGLVRLLTLEIKLPMAGKSHSWNAADPMVAANVPVLAWPPSVKPQRHVLTQLFTARSAHLKTEGAHSPTEQNVTLICYPM